nr:hypothetical protein [Massilia varians]
MPAAASATSARARRERNRIGRTAPGVEQLHQRGTGRQRVDHGRGPGGAVRQLQGRPGDGLDLGLAHVERNGFHQHARRFDRSVTVVAGSTGADLGGETFRDLLAQGRQITVGAPGAFLDLDGGIGNRHPALADGVDPEIQAALVRLAIEQLLVNLADAPGRVLRREAHRGFLGSGKSIDEETEITIGASQLGRPEGKTGCIGWATVVCQIE